MVYFDDVRPVAHGVLTKPSLTRRTVLLIQIRMNLIRYLEEERSRRSRCLVEAEWFNHHYVGTEHLLLGVCCLTCCKAAKLLTDIGKPPIELCQLVVEVVGHGHEWGR